MAFRNEISKVLHLICVPLLVLLSNVMLASITLWQSHIHICWQLWRHISVCVMAVTNQHALHVVVWWRGSNSTCWNQLDVFSSPLSSMNSCYQATHAIPHRHKPLTYTGLVDRRHSDCYCSNYYATRHLCVEPHSGLCYYRYLDLWLKTVSRRGKLKNHLNTTVRPISSLTQRSFVLCNRLRWRETG
jgi:hypothetical protein